MKNSHSKAIARKFNIIFGILTYFCYFMVKILLHKAGYSKGGRNQDFEEAFTAVSLIICMLVSLHLYSREKKYSYLFNVSYMAGVCLVVLLVFLPMGYSKYMIEYSVVGSWIYYIFLCVIAIAWNLARVIYPGPPKKRW